MARVAGHLKPTIKINIRAMGINAINADKLRDKTTPPYCSVLRAGPLNLSAAIQGNHSQLPHAW